MKTLKLLGFFLVISILMLSVMPFQSCEKDEDNDNKKCDTCKNICDTCIVVYKPNIYLYPKEKMQLSVKLDFPMGGGIVTSVPEYGNGWNITVDTNGIIDNSYTYLFYESQQPDVWQNEAGWVIKQGELKVFFKENMTHYGFLGQEIQDFIDYWIPRLSSYEYYGIYPQTSEIINKVIRLNFSKEPDNLLRLFYLVKGLNSLPENTLIVPQPPAIFERNGFYVTEWGVILK